MSARDEQLAIHGGQPVRPQKKQANPVIARAARDEVLAVLESGRLAQFYGGTHVREFEREYARWFGRRHAVAVNSGTAALHVTYIAARLPERSEVLIPANAYISVLSALLQAHLIPVIVDVDAQSWVMDPEDCQRKITARTSAIVAVHMYGQPCPLGALAAIAHAGGLTLIEDCGQAHGALWDGQKTGTFGQAAAFSLCCRKHIALGEGGIVITDDPELAAVARSLAHKGKGESWFAYQELGFSYNMTEIQAVLGKHQLRRLGNELKRRNALAHWVRQELAATGLQFPLVPPGSTHAYFKLNALLPPALAQARNEIVAAISAENVGCDPAHPHLLDIAWVREQHPYFLRTLPPGERPDYGPATAPVARDILRRQIGIEIGPGLTQDDLACTVAAIRKVLACFQAHHSRWEVVS
ncbi:MAG TPA: DegT/DnrJ/EryC1/StrS family aminotransferase [Ktedonobacteraceae bacterium]|jgi:perosamine synthetase